MIKHSLVYILFLIFFSKKSYCSDENKYSYEANSGTRRTNDRQDVYMKRSGSWVPGVANITQYPFIAQIKSSTYERSTNTWLSTVCTGVIIGKRWVLTSGQCSTELMQVSVGHLYKGLDCDICNVAYDVIKHYRHPRYYKLWFKTIGETTFYDYMLLELKDELVYGPAVSELQLALRDDLMIGITGDVIGFRYLGDSVELDDMAVTVARRGRCKNIPEKPWHIYESRDAFCGDIKQVYVDPGPSICQMALTGGAFLHDNRLLGIVTLAHRCSEMPMTFSSIFFAKDWIYDIMKNKN